MGQGAVASSHLKVLTLFVRSQIAPLASMVYTEVMVAYRYHFLVQVDVAPRLDLNVRDLVVRKLVDLLLKSCFIWHSDQVMDVVIRVQNEEGLFVVIN